jgi:hypothetical protein
MEPTSLYVRFRGQVTGPYSPEQMLEKVQAGQLSTVHWVSEDQSSWTLARDIGWLFPTAMPSAAALQPIRPVPAAVSADRLADLAAAVPAAKTAGVPGGPVVRPASPMASAPAAVDADLAAQARRLKWITITFAAAAVLLITALTTFVLYKVNQ